MVNITFPVIGGSRLRATVLDLCGIPAWGDKAQLVTKGFVSVAVTANYDDGTVKEVTNANGEKCVYVPADAELLNLSVDAKMCEVDPDLYSAMTGQPKIVDPLGNVIGFVDDRSVRPTDVAVGLEVWGGASGGAGCDVGSSLVPYYYHLTPYLTGGRIGDYTLDNNAVTFSVTGMTSKDGTQWGVGPYLVLPDINGDPTELYQPLTSSQHRLLVRTIVAPPDVTPGLIPLDDPDEAAATGATAGIPGAFTPTGGVRPADFAELDGGSITATPATAWTTGQYVYLGDGSQAYYDGTDWQAGVAP